MNKPIHSILPRETQIKIGIELEQNIQVCSNSIIEFKSEIAEYEREGLFESLRPERAAEIRQIYAESLLKMKGIHNELRIAIDKIKSFELTDNDFNSVANGVAELQRFGEIITDKILDIWNKTFKKSDVN